MFLLPSLVELLQPFFAQMTAPTAASFCSLVAGWIFARRHNVTGALRAVEKFPKHHSAYHRVFSAARWSMDAVGLGLLGLIVLSFASDCLFLAIDDTVCRKRGRKMYGTDSHYDCSITSRRRSRIHQTLKVRGHCWVMLGVVLPLPWNDKSFLCLPVLFRLYMNRKAAERYGEDYQSRPDLGRQLLTLVCEHFPAQCFHALADSAYAGQDTLKNLPENCELTCRWQINIRLCGPAPQHRAKGQRGRLPRRGKPLPSPRQMIQKQGEKMELDLYGRHNAYRVATCLACLYTVPDRLLRIVVTEPLRQDDRASKAQALYYSTATWADATAVLCWYARRWSLEVAIHDAKQQMGMGQAQSWTCNAVLRCAPTLMLLYSAVCLWFLSHGHRFWRTHRWPWYPHKSSISFADMLATLRWRTLRQSLGDYLATHSRMAGSRKAVGTLLRLVRLAA